MGKGGLEGGTQLGDGGSLWVEVAGTCVGDPGA